MNIIIESIETKDIRFPTSQSLDGSDAMNADPDYSAAYVILHTNHPEWKGYGLTFTIGRGNEICVQAIESMAPLLVGMSLEEIRQDMAGFWRKMVGDSQLRWLGPEKGVIHMVTGALVNAVWDLYARVEGKPLWQLISDMSPEELISCIDFTYLTNVLRPEEALEILQQQAAGKEERIANLKETGYPAYTTSMGWLGYSEDKIRRLCKEAKVEGWINFKMKVGKNLEDDMRRAAIIREEIGDDKRFMMDANQYWEVDEAIANMKQLAQYNPWWIEEPTSPDDVLGHKEIKDAISPVKVTTGEHCQNRMIFKQFMQAGSIDICQIDSCRVAGVNEILAIMLMAAKFNIPVCPHAGGVGLCEYVQHLSMIDYICMSGTMENRMIEFVDHLHEHFESPVIIKDGHYMMPDSAGYSIKMKELSLNSYSFPEGEKWQEINKKK